MVNSDVARLQPAVDALLEELQSLDQQRTELVRSINMLNRRMGKPEIPLPDDAQTVSPQTIRPDQFFGRPLATAVTELLESRRSAMPLDEIVAALEAGGHQIRGEHPKRTLAIAFSKNRKFVTLPNSDAVGLREWYPALKNQKNGKSAGDAIADAVDELVGDANDENERAPGAKATEGA